MPGLRTIAGLDDRQAADRVAVEGAGVRQPREPCRQSTFDASNCDQPWRWNLDYVVDVRGNTMSLWYTKETNNYGRNLTPTKVTPYTRGGYLARIDYGTDQRTLVSGVKTDTVYRLSNPPSQVVFTPADRCLSGCATHDEAHWPDTPWDQNCSASPCTGIFSPTFWSTKRLATVKTRCGAARPGGMWSRGRWSTRSPFRATPPGPACGCTSSSTPPWSEARSRCRTHPGATGADQGGDARNAPDAAG
jgi:hypothetical protein